jgi:hypothetical protein
LPIQASIGKHHYGTKQCYNLPKDQLFVANLLDLIGTDQGGTDGKLLLGLEKIRWGIVDERLYQALQIFQKKQFGSTDGHVDPNERTIRKLEALAFPQDAEKKSTGSVTGTNIPNQPTFASPTPDGMPNPNNPVLDWTGRALDTLSFAGSMVELLAGAVVAEIAGIASAILGLISALLSAPMAWDAADRKAKFNGYCNGYWNAFQDMAEAFRNDALDSLIKVVVTPTDDTVPAVPGNTAPVVWPAIPTPSPHMSALNEADLTESERQNRAGEREGCQKAYDYIMGLERSPQQRTWTQQGHQYKVTATGRVMLRLLYKGAKGKGGVASLIQKQINAELKKQGKGEWPVH